jgi:hypothetical protein
MRPSRDELLFWLGVALWVGVLVVTWPNALSFGDEVGYVGQAKLLLSGHIRWVPHSPGVWGASAHGLINKYPLLQSVILTPFVALTPRAIFLVTLVAAIALVALARSILVSWGKSPLWALLILSSPTVVILTRTVMGDVGQAAAMLGAWWALRRGRTVATLLWMPLLVALKPTGAVLSVAVVGVEALSSRAALRARDPATWRRFGWAALGGAVGFAVTFVSNYLENGTLWFGYRHYNLSTPPFWYTYLPERAPAHLLTLLVNPPLLIAGAWVLWRRRELGPLVLSVGYVGMMCVYYFIDNGANMLETMVLSPRLILPSIVFLLLGYGTWLEDLARRFLGARAFDGAGRTRPWLAALLVILPVAVCAGVSARHERFQEPMARARAVASGLADARGGVLGLTRDAMKVGLLYHGRTTLYDEKENRPAVVLCNEASASHRSGDEPIRSCALDGYREIGREAGLVVLARPE